MGLLRSAANFLRSATTAIDVYSATAPISGQVLTATGSTAATWQTPSGAATIVTCQPIPVIWDTLSGTAQRNCNSNTTMQLGLFNIPAKIVVNKLTVRTGGTVTTPGTWDFTIYAEDGQSQVIAVTSGTIDTAGKLYTITVAGVTVNPGNYWIAVNPNGTADGQFFFYTDSGSQYTSATDGLLGGVASEPVLVGTLTITAGTPPATFTPSSVTLAANNRVFCRLDN